MKNVRQAAKDILARHDKINFLVLSPGVLSFARDDITEDGVERSAALVYYSRWKFIYDLTPALTKAREEHEDAKVLSVLSAGNGGKIDLGDLPLKKASTITAIKSMMTYNDIMMNVSTANFLKVERGLTITVTVVISSYPGFCLSLSLSLLHSLLPRICSHTHRIKLPLLPHQNPLFHHQLLIQSFILPHNVTRGLWRISTVRDSVYCIDTGCLEDWETWE